MSVAHPTSATRPLGPWTALELKLDFSRYVPRPVEPAGAHHIESERWGRQLVLKGDTGSYLLLSERDEFIYECMDGARSVQDLVLEYFHKYESFSFDRVSVLVTRLREAGLLEDPPIEAFAVLRDRIERRKTEGRVRRVAGLFFDCRLEIRGIDRAVTLAYKWFFRLFFTRIAYAVYVVVAAIGLAAFAKVVSDGRFPLSMLYTSSGGSVAYGALTLVGATAFLVFFHQAAHVFAAKSLGREVPCAGFIINYGLPFFYATTTDVWLESRFSRIMVSMAGTISDLLLGSAGALLLIANPDPAWAWGPLVFKLSVVSFAALFMDLNPLFELDGYYALSDYLEIPDLRARSIRFLRRELWGKLKRREGLAREDRIFASYGTLALGWTGVIVVAALAFLLMQVRSAVADIFTAESWVSVGLSIAVLVFFVIPVTLAVMALGALAVWRAVRWVRGHPTFKDARRLLRLLLGVAAVSGGAVFVLPWLAHELVEIPAAAAVGRILPTERFLPVWGLVYPALAPGLLAAAALFALAAAREVRGSRLAGTLRFLSIFLVFETARSAWESYMWTWGLQTPITRVVTEALEVASWAALGGWALHLLVRVEFPLMGWARRVIATAAAIGLAGWLIGSTWRLDMSVWEAARLSLAFAATTAVVVALVPALANYWRTLLWWGWALLLVGLGARSLSGLARLSVGWVWVRTLTAGIQLALFGAVVLMFALLICRAILRRMAVRAHRTERASAEQGDRARLVAAFGFLVESLAENLRQAYGRASMRAVERAFNRRARRAGKEVRLEAGRFESPGFDRAGILKAAEECRWTLGEIERLASMHAGTRFFHGLVTAVYDELYWNEREPVFEHVMSAFPWAGGVAHLPRPEERGIDQLVEGAPLFEGLSPDERADLTARMRPRRVRPGESVVREGDPAEAFYLISSGELEVFHADAPDEALATLAAGDYFGEAVHEKGARRGASVRAKTDAEVLELDAADYRAFVREHVSVAEKVDEAGEVVGMFRRMPAFREMPLAQVALLASAMKPVRVPAGEDVVRQGDPGTALYVIRSGELEVLVGRDGGPPRRVAVLGRGEYFGEIALLESVPRTATVRALVDCDVLSLEKEDFDRRVGKSLAAIQGLGRISSRRRREITERQTDGGFAAPDLRPVEAGAEGAA